MVIEVKNLYKTLPRGGLLVTETLNYLITPVINDIFGNLKTTRPVPSLKVAVC